MSVLSFENFIKESESVKLKKDLREYTLVHLGEDKFSLKDNDMLKEFSVIPYKSETLDKLKSCHKIFISAIESESVEKLYESIKESEKIQYGYGNIFTSKYSLNIVPELTTSLTDEQLKTLGNSETEFLLNNYSELNKQLKTDIISSLRDRAEILCVIIEALFYYIRTIDKKNFYNGKSESDIIEEYEKEIKECSKLVSFSYEGPFSDTLGNNHLEEGQSTGFWTCEKYKLKFYIKATISPSELYTEENIGGTKGMKFSLGLQGDGNPIKEFSFFNINELENRLIEFYKKNKNNGKK